MFNVLITGANRGLGRCLAEEFLRRPDAMVVVAVRDLGAADGCHALQRAYGDRVRTVRLDYADEQSINGAVASCEEFLDHLDILVNCGAASTAPGWPRAASAGPVADLEYQALSQLFSINVIGPVLTCRGFLPLLRKGANAGVVNISSIRASMAAAEAGSFGYSVTKAALNMGSRKLAAELAEFGIGVVSVHPGWMRTRMGGRKAPLSAESVAQELIRNVVPNVRRLTGRFVDTSGTDIAW